MRLLHNNKPSFLGVASALLFMMVTQFSAQQIRESIPPEGGYVKFQGNSRVIVFVHGLNSSGADAWRCDGNHFWPEMIAKDNDPVLENSDIYVVGYPTPKRGGKMTMPDLITGIADRLRSENVFTKHKEVVFVAHSMGGLLTEQLILTYRDKVPNEKISAIFFYGTPLEGSKLANWGKFFNSDPLIKELQSGDSNVLLHDIDQRWLHAGLAHIKRYCTYEKLREDGVIVVDQDSATRDCYDERAINTTHRDLVKPCSITDDSYIWLKDGLDEMDSNGKGQNASSAPASPSPTGAPIFPPNLYKGAPSVSVYEQVTKVRDYVDALDRDWGSAVLRVEQVHAAPYKFGNQQGKPVPNSLPIEYVDQLNVAEWRAVNGFVEYEPTITSAREAALKCMQLTPNQEAADQILFANALTEASAAPTISKLSTLPFDGGHFSSISSYLMSLQQRIGDYHCEAK